jgi:hypothetical protein
VVTTSLDSHIRPVREAVGLGLLLPLRFIDSGALANSRTVERMTLLGRELAQRLCSYLRTGWRLRGAEGAGPGGRS